ncbi:hypothetical protein PEDI_15990 [Persicobacter diffluens]|uniref:Uncharacterized protein n=1 Tax=Persicobacter diffluens TaxID=981 RepID=A0AAN5AJN5_9BACT|nr:hypothetical protein PEDI_15990 [Persicobacter diffluens]
MDFEEREKIVGWGGLTQIRTKKASPDISEEAGYTTRIISALLIYKPFK